VKKTARKVEPWWILPGLLALGACGSDERPADDVSVESVFTRIDAASCTETIDESDPNDTPIRLCQGVGSLSLLVRRVGSGRRSVDVRVPAAGDFPLDLTEIISRHMLELDPQVEWRVSRRDGELLPIALVLRVGIHADEDEPETVTETYAAIARISPEAICLTDRLPESAVNDSSIRAAADTARDRDCLPPLPPSAGN